VWRSITHLSIGKKTHTEELIEAEEVSQEANNLEKIQEREYYADKIMGQKTNVRYLRKTYTIYIRKSTRH
jgi:hypothetical protein